LVNLRNVSGKISKSENFTLLYSLLSTPAASKLHLFKTFGWAVVQSNKILKKINEEKLNFAFMNPEELYVNYC